MNIVFAAGGTGGHFIPAIRVAREIRKANPEARLLFMGTGKPFELEACRRENIEFMKIPSAPLRRGTITSNILLPIETFVGMIRSARKMIHLRTDVIVSMGGYPSVPPFLSAGILGIPRLVHEQNAEPGLASRMESFLSNEVCLSYERSKAHIGGRGNVTVTGNPATPSLQEVVEAKSKRKSSGPNLLVMGGSQGAHALNEVVTKYLLETGADPWRKIYFQTGRPDCESVRERLSGCGKAVVVEPFFYDMNRIYADVDAAVTRAGATTIAELSGWGIPSVLVPYPYSTGGHQMKNAELMEKLGAAVLVEQSLFNHRRLARLMESIVGDRRRWKSMSGAAAGLARHNAARDVALKVLNLAESKRRRGGDA